MKSLRPWRELLVSAVALMLTVPCLQAGTFHSSRYTYSVDTPENWTPVPDEAIQKFVAATFKPGASAPVIDAVFELDSHKRPFQFPYVIFEVLPNKNFGLPRQITDAQIAQTVHDFAGANVKNLAANSVSDAAMSKIASAAAGNPTFDPHKRQYMLPMQFVGAGGVPVRSRIFGFFGHDAMVQLCFYTNEADEDRIAQVAQRVADGFHFDAEAQYRESESGASGFSSVGERSALIGAVTGCFVGLFILRKRQTLTSHMTLKERLLFLLHK